MSLRSIQVRRFRSIASAGLTECGGLNILIGKNNAGKSNLLSAIELMFTHLKRGRIAGPWPVQRPSAEFTDRDSSNPIRIGIEFDLSSELSEALRERLTKEAPHLERSIEQIRAHNSVVFILAGVIVDSQGFLFVEQLTVGKLTSKNGDISGEGIKLLSVGKQTAFELYRNYMSARAYESDLKNLEELRAGRRVPLDYIFNQPKEQRTNYLLRFVPPMQMRQELTSQLLSRLSSAASQEEFATGVAQLIVETCEKMEAVEKCETESSLPAFAGETKISPAYAE